MGGKLTFFSLFILFSQLSLADEIHREEMDYSAFEETSEDWTPSPTAEAAETPTQIREPGEAFEPLIVGSEPKPKGLSPFEVASTMFKEVLGKKPPVVATQELPVTRHEEEEFLPSDLSRQPARQPAAVEFTPDSPGTANLTQEALKNEREFESSVVSRKKVPETYSRIVSAIEASEKSQKRSEVFVPSR